MFHHFTGVIHTCTCDLQKIPLYESKSTYTITSNFQYVKIKYSIGLSHQMNAILVGSIYAAISIHCKSHIANKNFFDTIFKYTLAETTHSNVRCSPLHFFDVYLRCLKIF